MPNLNHYSSISEVPPRSLELQGNSSNPNFEKSLVMPTDYKDGFSLETAVEEILNGLLCHYEPPSSAKAQKRAAGELLANRTKSATPQKSKSTLRPSQDSSSSTRPIDMRNREYGSGSENFKSSTMDRYSLEELPRSPQFEDNCKSDGRSARQEKILGKKTLSRGLSESTMSSTSSIISESRDEDNYGSHDDIIESVDSNRTTSQYNLEHLPRLERATLFYRKFTQEKDKVGGGLSNPPPRSFVDKSSCSFNEARRAFQQSRYAKDLQQNATPSRNKQKQNSISGAEKTNQNLHQKSKRAEKAIQNNAVALFGNSTSQIKTRNGKRQKKKVNITRSLKQLLKRSSSKS